MGDRSHEIDGDPWSLLKLQDLVLHKESQAILDDLLGVVALLVLDEKTPYVGEVGVRVLLLVEVLLDHVRP